jgi:phosphate starvation-inducible PhoH-like protein
MKNSEGSLIILNRSIVIGIVVLITTLSFAFGYFVGRYSGSRTIQETEVKEGKQAGSPQTEVQRPLEKANIPETAQSSAPQQPVETSRVNEAEVQPEEANTEKAGSVPPSKEISLKKGFYYLQVGAFKDSQRASRLKESLQKEHYDVIIKKDSSNVHKVFVGSFRARKEAQLAQTRIKKLYGIDSIIIKQWGKTTVTLEFELKTDEDYEYLHSVFGKNIQAIEETLGVVISARGNKIIIKGEEGSAQRARKIIDELKDLSSQGYSIKPEDIRYCLEASPQEPSLKALFMSNIPVSSKKRFIVPKTETQKEYIEAIQRYDIVIGIGPAGTGKTYLAMAMAVNALLKKQVTRIVLARPAVEAGEKLGFLPGDIEEKVSPYLRPLYDALFDMMEPEKVAKYIERGVIEIAPLAFMRGRTLNDSFIILDEAQNTTSEQMKMYLTRLGFNSKTVITGDVTQIDLPAGKISGLVEAEKILKGIEGIRFVYFTERDVVRHRLVQEIIRAYERYERTEKQYQSWKKASLLYR